MLNSKMQCSSAYCSLILEGTANTWIVFYAVDLMLKSWPLCTSAKNRISETEFGVKVEKNSSIALPGKGEHSGLLPLKTELLFLLECRKMGLSNLIQ